MERQYGKGIPRRGKDQRDGVRRQKLQPLLVHCMHKDRRRVRHTLSEADWPDPPNGSLSAETELSFRFTHPLPLPSPLPVPCLPAEKLPAAKSLPPPAPYMPRYTPRNTAKQAYHSRMHSLRRKSFLTER